MEDRYNHLNKYLKNKFGERVLKICVDGGFTCPNRDGTKGKNGCIFCSERGSGEHLCSESIEKQVKNHLSSYRGERANKFIVYFQNFSNTYDTIENLKKKYDEALCDSKIVGLEIATRPDCVNEEIAKLLQQYTKKYYVVVELGLQTANDNIGKLLNRCYDSKDFENAVNVLSKYGIDVVAHIMVGLPDETLDDIAKTVCFLNSQKISGVKIHSTYVIKNTKLAEMYNIGKYKALTLDEYIDKTCYIISRLRKDIIIHRISGDAPKDMLIAPEWNRHKKWSMNGIEKRLKELDIWQGQLAGN